MRALDMYRIRQLSRLRNNTAPLSSTPMSSTFLRNIIQTRSSSSQLIRNIASSQTSKKSVQSQICQDNLPTSDYWRSAFGNVYSSSASRIFEDKKTHTALPKSDYWGAAFTNVYSSSASHIFKMAAYKLLCLENPLLDIQAPGDQEMLTKYGLKVNDTLLAEPHQMDLYEDLISRGAKLIPGGAAQNTARGAQYMLPPSSVFYIGSVGNDDYAKTLRSKCAEQGLHVEYHVDSEPTGKCGVVITDQNRTMLTHLAAANNYKLEHLQQSKIWSMVESASVYYVGGYHLTVCPPAAMALGKHAASSNKPFMFSLSAGFIPQFFKDPVAELMPYCDYVFGNENEMTTWATSQGQEGISILEATKLTATKLDKVNNKRPRIVICTQGTDPTIVATKEEGKDVTVKEYPVAEIGADKINDTNGAGDAFAGGFCAGVVEGKSIDECVKMGHWLARLSLQELGPSYPVPKQTYTS